MIESFIKFAPPVYFGIVLIIEAERGKSIHKVIAYGFLTLAFFI